MNEQPQMGPVYTVIYWATIGLVIYVFFILLRWMITTREGMITTVSLLGIILMVNIFAAVFGGSGATQAHAHVPSMAAGRTAAQDPNMGWHTVIRNGQICTSYRGQQFPCTPITAGR